MADTQPPGKAGSYDFRTIEARWQAYWEEHKSFAVANPGDPGFDGTKPKCYVLDMFPYPSGAGLHVGHPLGYCATDIYSRYKRMRGFNVLHPMGYDAFGLPAEQYAIEHGVHPAITTRRNIENMRRQLKMFGFSYDWDREIATCDPEYYKHTQWIFLQMFNSWFDDEFDWTDHTGRPYKGKARPVSDLEAALRNERLFVDDALKLVRDPKQPHRKWSELSPVEQRQAINNQRLAFIDEVPVNWCPALGTVLANEEVTSDGRSERGNHPVFRRPLRQWMLRITKYAERLLNDLELLDWPEPIKIMQRNWIGRSTGAEVDFPLVSGGAAAPVTPDPGQWRAARRSGGYPARPEPFTIRVYTTRPDTLFGATYMVLAPEHPLVDQITTPDQRASVEEYVTVARHKSDLDRTADTKEKTGVFTGAYALNPVNGERIPVWVADYVLMGYGTGAIMAVPAHDTRDFDFAKAFDLPIVAVVRPPGEWLHEQIIRGAIDEKYCARKGRPSLRQEVLDSATLAAGTVGGITAQNAMALLDGDSGWLQQVALPVFAEDPGIFAESFVGEGVNLNSPPRGGAGLPRDVCTINDLPTPKAKTRITQWLEQNGLGQGAVNYKLRDWVFSRQKYWGEPFPVLHGEDGEIIPYDEKDLPVALPPMEDFKPTPVAEGSDALPEPPLGRAKDWVTVQRDGTTWRHDLNTMPQWAGSCWYYLRYLNPTLSSRFCDRMADDYWMPVDTYVGGAEHAVLHLLYARFWHKVLFDLDCVSTCEPFMKLVNQGMIQGFAFKDERGATITPDLVEEVSEGKFRHKQTGEPVGPVIAKMSKSLKNVVNPDDVIGQFGADTFRLYEMFMGPIEASKPWNTRDVPGLFKLLSRIWRLFIDEETGRLSPALADEKPDAECLRVLHKTIRGVGDDIEQLKFNTAIAKFFDFVNFMTPRSKRPRTALEPFVLLLAPFAPHIAEELWRRLGHEQSLIGEAWPAYEETLARDESVEIAVQVNGKIKSRIHVPADADDAQIEALARADAKVADAIAGKTVRRVIVAKGRLVNLIAN
jgi:leucyl-tRNA synthetase